MNNCSSDLYTHNNRDVNKTEAAYSCLTIPTIQPVTNNSPNLPWITSSHGRSCNRISSYPSPVISFEIDYELSKFTPPLSY